jgi:hypothetical protein
VVRAVIGRVVIDVLVCTGVTVALVAVIVVGHFALVRRGL